ncbi:MAG TPA: hypothetical protein VK279_04605 [Solirubrobacteraceae bacterium]|nr:hypothetical protein [Solirubrobacteraceae bacterium]
MHRLRHLLIAVLAISLLPAAGAQATTSGGFDELTHGAFAAAGERALIPWSASSASERGAPIARSAGVRSAGPGDTSPDGAQLVLPGAAGTPVLGGGPDGAAVVYAAGGSVHSALVGPDGASLIAGADHGPGTGAAVAAGPAGARVVAWTTPAEGLRAQYVGADGGPGAVVGITLGAPERVQAAVDGTGAGWLVVTRDGRLAAVRVDGATAGPLADLGQAPATWQQAPDPRGGLWVLAAGAAAPELHHLDTSGTATRIALPPGLPRRVALAAGDGGAVLAYAAHGRGGRPDAVLRLVAAGGTPGRAIPLTRTAGRGERVDGVAVETSGATVRVLARVGRRAQVLGRTAGGRRTRTLALGETSGAGRIAAGGGHLVVASTSGREVEEEGGDGGGSNADAFGVTTLHLLQAGRRGRTLTVRSGTDTF